MIFIYEQFLIKRKRDNLKETGENDAIIQCLNDLLLEIQQENGMYWSEFPEAQIKLGANPEVIGFIYEALTHNGIEQAECIRSFFRAGYCWYFAHMLKLAFDRGEVCIAAPFGHFVWVDIDGNPYDIEGLYFGEAEYFIPESYLGNKIKDFKWIPGVSYNASEEEINELINQYKENMEENNCEKCL